MTLSQKVSKGIRSPGLVGRALNRLYYSHVRSKAKLEGEYFFDKDWDNLIILDGCRYDLFKKVNTLPGELSHCISRGASTEEFLAENIVSTNHFDTVYVTANPMLEWNREDLPVRFYAEEQVWAEEGWDEEYGTVLPEVMARRAEEAYRKYPNKRLVVHFIQPHFPFIDSELIFDKHQMEDSETQVWNRVMEGRVDASKQDIWEAYETNLTITLPYVKSLLELFEGKTVVTSDHGNLIGDRAFPIPIREWGHPSGIHMEKLIKVPWLEYYHGDRRTITEEVPVEESRKEIDETVERLHDLGYLSERAG